MSLLPLEGHEETRRAVVRALGDGALPAALLVSGPPGVGKQRLALWVGQLVLCETPVDAGPCGSCPGCSMSVSLQHPDMHWHFPLLRPRATRPDRLADALEEARAEVLAERRSKPLYPTAPPAGAIYLAAVRRIRSASTQRPALGGEHVFVIGEAERLVPQEAGQEAGNALLKVLEEPPGPCRFILTSSEPAGLLPTIRSRTVPITLAPLPISSVADFLRERSDSSADEVEKAAALSRGSIGRALGFLERDGEPGELETVRQEAFGLVGSALAGVVEMRRLEADGSGRRDGRFPRPNLGRVYKSVLGFGPRQGTNHDLLLSFVEEWLRDLGAVGTGAPEQIWNRDSLDRLERVVERTGILPSDVADACDHVSQARELLKGNVNPQLAIYGLLLALTRSAARTPARPRAGA